MTLCSEGHDEVCYESRNCPACEVIKEKDKEIEILKDEIDDLKSRDE